METLGERLSSDDGYIGTIDISNLGLKPSSVLGKYVGIRIILINTDAKSKQYRIFFDRLDKAGKVKDNYQSRKERDKNFVGFSVLEDEAIEIGGMNVEKSEPNSKLPNLTGIKNEDSIKVSDFILDFTMEYLRQEGYDNFITGSIRKPILAKTLMRHGFLPVLEDINVEVITRENVRIIVAQLKKYLKEKISKKKELEKKAGILRTADDGGGVVRSKSGTLVLSGNKGELLLIQQEISALEESIENTHNKISRFLNGLEDNVPIVNWYGERKDDEGNYIRPSSADAGEKRWFILNSISNTAPPNDTKVVPIQTRFHYVKGCSERVNKTRANVLHAIGKVLFNTSS